MSGTGIEWTDETWNPMTGCTEISPGCDHCYARVVAERRLRDRYLAQAPMRPGGENEPFAPRFWPERLEQPLKWRAPRRVFVNSMTDVFHSHFDLAHIAQVFDVIARAERHQFQMLTKRPERAARLARDLPWPPNLWFGVTVESREYLSKRLDALKNVPARVKFLSCEPLLGPLVGFEFEMGVVGGPPVDWVIVGGESGHGARPMELDWARHIRDVCAEREIAFFLKQLGGFPNPRAHEEAVLDGRRHVEWPAR